jgi:poly(3-hydroxybutyrate) depolymerase
MKGKTMRTKLNLLAAGMFLAALGTGFGQPVITTQPQDQTNTVGTIATLTVAAAGTEPLSYQWQKLGGIWADLAGCTDTNLCFTNVQTAHTGDYRVVVTNADGAVTSQVAKMTVVLPPSVFLKSLAPYQRMAVYRGSSTSLATTVSGTSPLSFQWRLEGFDLPGKTNQTLTIAAAQLADEGNYTVVVSNPWGAVTSAPARLYVTPPAAQFIRHDFTNEARLRLPYFLLQPENYNPTRSYPLVCVLHGTPGDETLFQTYADIGPQAIGALYASYRQQQKDPPIVVWPARRTGDGDWTTQYVQLLLGLLDRLAAGFNVDTNRVYIVGMSEGVHAVWDCLGSRPGYFGGATVLAGWVGNSRAASIRGVPVWAFCAADDSLVGSTRDLVRALRLAGGNVIYTEYKSGGHMDGIAMGLCTPVAVDWLLAQRRGQPSTNEPLVTITEPTAAEGCQRGGTVINLSGCAAALGQTNRVSWTNFANNAHGIATGTNLWSATGIPLQANRTNMVVVVATTTSWAPAFGGSTTFNDVLAVSCAPIRATLARQDTSLLLNWTGGGPPYRVQRATDLAAGDWNELLPNATSPLLLPLPLAGGVGFFRIVGQ